MKTSINLKKGDWRNKVLIMAMALFMVTCVTFEGGVEGPETALIGETVTFTVHPLIDRPNEGRDNIRLVLGFLAPKSWNAAENAVITYTSDVDQGLQSASLMPESILVAYSEDLGGGTKLNWQDLLHKMYGVGPNVLQDMQWVVYQTDKTYNIAANEVIHSDFHIKINVGQQNLRAKLGFFVGNTTEGIWMDSHYEVQYSDCFEVTGGRGAIVDFCELHLNSATPTSGTQDDIITLIYQGDILENDLQDAAEVYLCATAYTDAGNSYEVCGSTEKTRMTKTPNSGQTFEISIWPAGYFNIPEGEEITDIDYSFTNADGSIEVMSNMSDEDDTTWQPFSYTVSCSN